MVTFHPAIQLTLFLPVAGAPLRNVGHDGVLRGAFPPVVAFPVTFTLKFV